MLLFSTLLYECGPVAQGTDPQIPRHVRHDVCVRSARVHVSPK